MKPLVFVSAFMLAGCASGLQVTYLSGPPGAAIYYEDGRPFDRAPVTISYTADPTFRAGGFQRLRGRRRAGLVELKHRSPG